jgi:hypothetical protein
MSHSGLLLCLTVRARNDVYRGMWQQLVPLKMCWSDRGETADGPDYRRHRKRWMPSDRFAGRGKEVVAPELLRLATDRGVQRAVVLSALTVEYGGGDERFADEFRAIEAAVKASGMLGRALGRHLSWVEMPADQVRAGMIARGLPEEIPDRMLGYLADLVERPGPSTTTVSDILGRPARTFSQWAVENVADFRN